ncbi:hypothetical protein BT96DRAFT_1012892 [Gymnopus androsaceus JB14]|uniref:Uncharacterized protein n=1 Tax=Gymnopus androsaceus JB14 TaxID=1447944 RepID=A0A6A4IF96_9AGAR|nr:hypothetical protein BT96DRAFT_1012892 [Gymnopus androsaceus JB14]
MAEHSSSHNSRHGTQRSVSRTNTSISASTQQGHAPSPQPIPLPSPVPVLDPQRPIRSFYATNPDPNPDTEDSGDDFVNIENVDGTATGYRSEPVVPRKKDDLHLRLIAMVTEQPAARATLPTYMFTPPTPVAPAQQTSYVDERVSFPQPEIESPDILPPTTSPHPTRIEVDDNTTIHREPDVPPVSRHQSQHNTTRNSNRNSYAYPSSYRDPPSIAAHPQPSPDYRRMSRHTGEEGGPLSYSTNSPSFSTELDRAPFRLFKVFSTLINMPWVSHERVTVDYSPGMDGSRGVLRTSMPEGVRTSRSSKDRQSIRWSIANQGWQPWKRMTVFFTPDGRVISPQDGPSALTRGDARKGDLWIQTANPPSSKNQEGSGRCELGKRACCEVLFGINNTTCSLHPRNTHRQTPRRQSRVLYYPPDEYVFIDARSTPASSPILGRRVNPKGRHREHRDRNQHTNIRSRTSRDTSRPPQPPMPTAPSSPYPLSPLVFLPSNHLDSAGGATESHPQNASTVPVFGVTPVYMSVVPGMLPLPPRSVGSAAGESSPPGFAGRGAGGNYANGPGYGVQGYTGSAFNGSGGTYTYGYAYPYPHSQSPPPQVHHHDDHKQTSGQPPG